MSENLIGQWGHTSNTFINSLPVGTTLEYVGDGQVEVVGVSKGSGLGTVDPIVDFNEGDRIMTKYGPATVLRLTDRLDPIGAGLDYYDVLYIADGTTVVRAATRDEVSAV